jgi:8-amino-7-oxononanoate synthase
MPPASPTTDSLLRCSVSAAHTTEQIDRIIAAFATLNPSTEKQPSN